jgi:hypothetical protein
MHGPSAIPLLVELAATAIILTAAVARRPLACIIRAAATRVTAHRRRVREQAPASS